MEICRIWSGVLDRLVPSLIFVRGSRIIPHTMVQLKRYIGTFGAVSGALSTGTASCLRVGITAVHSSSLCFPFAARFGVAVRTIRKSLELLINGKTIRCSFAIERLLLLRFYHHSQFGALYDFARCFRCCFTPLLRVQMLLMVQVCQMGRICSNCSRLISHFCLIWRIMRQNVDHEQLLRVQMLLMVSAPLSVHHCPHGGRKSFFFWPVARAESGCHHPLV